MLRAMLGTRSGITTGCRFLSAAAAAPAAKPKVDKEALKELRQRTGYSFVNCKKALEQFDRTQLDAAVRWLHDLARKEGWKKAEKLSKRETSQGLVGVRIDGCVGAVVELQCETDFVARGEPFQQLLVSLSSAVVAHAKKAAWPATDRMQTKTLVFDELADESGKALREVLTDSVGRIGENLTVKSIHIYRAPEGVQFYGASHPKHTVEGVSMGRFVSVLAMRRGAPEGTVFPSVRLADQICQHVIGMRSEGLGEPPLPKVEKKEDAAVDEEKKDDDDELNSFFVGKTTSIDDSETALLRQAFMLNPSQTVHDYLQGHKAEVIDFARVELSA